MMWSQGKGHLEPRGAGGDRGPSLGALRGTCRAHPWVSASGAGREHVSVFSSYLLRGAWLQWPPETDTAAMG